MGKKTIEELERDFGFLWHIVSLYQEKEQLNEEIQNLEKEIDNLKKEVEEIKKSKVVYVPYSPTPTWPQYPQGPIYQTPIITNNENEIYYTGGTNNA